MTGLSLSACMKWQTQSLQRERFRAADSLETARLTLTNGDTLVLRGPVIVGDTPEGRQLRSGVAFDSRLRVSVPLKAINTAGLRQHDAAASTAALLVGIPAAMVVGATIWASTNPSVAFCSAH